MTREEAIKVLEMFLHKQCDLDRTKFAYDQNTVWEAVNMASKALEQEPCEDVVSRKDLYNALYEHFHDEDAPNNITEVRLGAVRNFVKDFPSVTPTQKWIPVSERLPEEDGKYLVTMKGIISNFFYISTTSYAKDLHKVNKYDFKSGIGDGWYDYDGEYGYYKIDNVVAWMPLPKPYNAEMESEE